MLLFIVISKFVLGFVLLIKGAGYLIKGSIAFANHLKIDKFIIGVIVISFGTSFPELIANIFASVKGENDTLVLGNILGSNISNVLFILAVSSIATPIFIKKRILYNEVVLNFFLGILLFAFVLISGEWIFKRWSGYFLLCLFVLYNVYLLRREKSSNLEEVEVAIPLSQTFFLIAIGMGGLYLGGDWLVSSSIYLAEEVLHIDKGLIGLTIMAFGTSLPELASCIVSAKRKETDLIVGTILGSNMYNIMIVLGISIAIKPVTFNSRYSLDLTFNLLIIAILILFYTIKPKHTLNASKGWVMLLSYFFYLIVTIFTKEIHFPF